MGRRQAEMGQTNTARQTLAHAALAAKSIDTTVIDWRNVLHNTSMQLCALARTQVAVVDRAGAQETLEIALKAAEIKEQDLQPPLNAYMDKTQVLPIIAATQAEFGNQTAARQIMESLKGWWEKGPKFGPLPVLRESTHRQTAIDKARAGDIPGALAALEAETDPAEKAGMLVSLAGVLLEAGPGLPPGAR